MNFKWFARSMVLSYLHLFVTMWVIMADSDSSKRLSKMHCRIASYHSLECPSQFINCCLVKVFFVLLTKNTILINSNNFAAILSKQKFTQSAGDLVRLFTSEMFGTLFIPHAWHLHAINDKKRFELLEIVFIRYLFENWHSPCAIHHEPLK